MATELRLELGFTWYHSAPECWARLLYECYCTPETSRLVTRREALHDDQWPHTDLVENAFRVVSGEGGREGGGDYTVGGDVQGFRTKGACRVRTPAKKMMNFDVYTHNK